MESRTLLQPRGTGVLCPATPPRKGSTTRPFEKDQSRNFSYSTCHNCSVSLSVTVVNLFLCLSYKFICRGTHVHLKCMFLL